MALSGSDSAKMNKMTELNLKQRNMIELESTHPYSISFNEKSHLWKTQVGKGKGDRKQITAKTKPELLEKLLAYYHTGMGFEQQMSDWLSARVSTGEIVQTTADNLLNRMKRLSSEDFRHKDVSLITEDMLRKDIAGRLDYFKKQGEPVRIREVKDYLNSVHALYRELKHRGVVSEDPAEYINAKSFLHKCDTSFHAPEDRVMQYDDMELLREDLWQDYGTTSNPRALMGLLSLDTGLRASELPVLRRDDVICNGTKLRVNKMQSKVHEGEHTVYRELNWTKDEKGIPKGGRKVPLLPSAAKTIETALGRPDVGNGLLFADSDGSMINKDSYERYLLRHCRKLGIHSTGNHSIRKGFNSYVLSQKLGLPSEARAMILGHSIEVDEKFYTFSGPTTQKMVDSVFDGLRKSHSHTTHTPLRAGSSRVR